MNLIKTLYVCELFNCGICSSFVDLLDELDIERKNDPTVQEMIHLLSCDSSNYVSVILVKKWTVSCINQ